jgi:hypothetical protein
MSVRTRPTRVCPHTDEHHWCHGRVCHARNARCYIRCGECGHPYRTRWHLLAAYRAVIMRDWWQEWRHGRPRYIGNIIFGVSPWMTRWYEPVANTWRPSKIYFCQCCTHDF